jgi:hypothetical protein
MSKKQQLEGSSIDAVNMAEVSFGGSVCLAIHERTHVYSLP